MILDQEIRNAINSALDECDSNWNQVKKHFSKGHVVAMELNENLQPTLYPGFPFIESGKPQVANYIAMVLDMRDSTEHLTLATSAKISLLNRVYHEIAALNAMGSVIVHHYEGKITEYLGDGFLAFFQVEDEQKPNTQLNAAKNCSEKCLDAVHTILNPILFERYGLRKIIIGIGLAYSQAIVTTMGVETYIYAKAIGKCVFEAAKRSDGKDTIEWDPKIRFLWKSSKGGTINFSRNPKRELESYILTQKKTKN